jgi:hypothetical protein
MLSEEILFVAQNGRQRVQVFLGDFLDFGRRVTPIALCLQAILDL